MALFILSRSPFERRDYTHLMELAAATGGNDVILIQDAVLALQSAPREYQSAVGTARARGVRFFALEPDLAARGVTAVGATPVTYRGFLDLVLAHSLTV